MERLRSYKGFRLVIEGRLVEEAKASWKRTRLSVANVLQARYLEKV